MKQTQKTALITGVTGQDGAYLSQFLLKKGYRVFGLKRRASSFNTTRIDHLIKEVHTKNANFRLLYGDLSDTQSVTQAIIATQPDEIYNLGAMSHVRVSFDIPEYTANVTGLGALRILEAIKQLKLEKKVKFYQASSSELFGNSTHVPQNEETPFEPRSPYAAAKLFAYWTTINYREAYGIFASNGILFNHESPLRGETFVTRKITRAVSKIALNLQNELYLGNLDAQRDWGHAKDYMEAAYLILQHSTPLDIVIGTKNRMSVRTFLCRACEHIGIQLAFSGSGEAEKGVIDSIDTVRFETIVGRRPDHLKVGRCLVKIDPRYFRPTEVETLQADTTRARTLLGWKPSYTVNALLKEMMTSDLHLMQQERTLKDRGFKIASPYEESQKIL